MIVLCDVFFVVIFEVVKLWQFYWLTVYTRVIQYMYKYLIVLFIFDMTFTFFFFIQFLKKDHRKNLKSRCIYVWQKITYQMVCRYSNPFSEAASLRVYVTSLPKSLDLTDKVIRDNISIFIPKCRLRYKIFEIFFHA